MPNLAGAMEAVIAAVYLDRGLEVAREMVVSLFAGEWRKSVDVRVAVDYKSRLQELTQSKFQQVPVYRLAAETGPDHDKTFTVEVTVNGEVMGTGSGRSKKEAETQAARLALESLDDNFTE